MVERPLELARLIDERILKHTRAAPPRDLHREVRRIGMDDQNLRSDRSNRLETARNVVLLVIGQNDDGKGHRSALKRS